MTWMIVIAIAWVVVCMGAGVLFGEIPVVKQNFELVVLGIILVSLIPVVTELWKARREARSQA